MKQQLLKKVQSKTHLDKNDLAHLIQEFIQVKELVESYSNFQNEFFQLGTNLGLEDSL